MKKGWRASLATLFLFAGIAYGRAPIVDGWIEKVSDGDSVWLQTEPLAVRAARGARLAAFFHEDLDEGKETRLKIRMLGIDAPETQLPVKGEGIVSQGHWGDDSSRYLRSLLPVGLAVKMEDHGLDSYKRTLGRIFNDEGDVNIRMVKRGHAVTYIYCTGKDCQEGFFEEQRVKEYVDACEQARGAGRGIWDDSDPLPEMPFAFRLRKQGRDPEKFSGHFQTKILYEPEDHARVPDCQRIWFRTELEAKRVGYELQ